MTHSYYKRKYEEQLELTYSYLDEIQRLQRIVDENDLDENASEENEEEFLNDGAEGKTKPKGKAVLSRRSSRCSDDFEEIKEKPVGNSRVA